MRGSGEGREEEGGGNGGLKLSPCVPMFNKDCFVLRFVSGFKNCTEFVATYSRTVENNSPLKNKQETQHL